MKKFFILATLLIGFNSYSQSQFHISLVKDINTAGSSFPFNFTVVNNQLFFTAISDTVGNELFISDGTNNGTHLVKNININKSDVSSIKDDDANPQELIILNNKIVFTADDHFHGNQIWISDGTTNGTFQLSTFGSNTGGNPQNFIAYNNKIYFTNYNYGGSLYSTDGTYFGTFKIKDFPVSNAYASNFILYNNLIFFTIGNELWNSDGTAIGTNKFLTINNHITGSSISNLIVFQNKLYFSAVLDSTGKELWVTDGTVNGTKLLKDLNISPNVSSSPTNFTECGNKLFFTAFDSSNIRKLWYLSNDSIYFVKNINPTVNAFECSYYSFHNFNNKLYFAATDNSAYNCELWVSDGSDTGTYKIKSKDDLSVMNPYYFLNWNGNFIFIAGDNYNRQLWISDGTKQNTYEIFDSTINNWGALKYSPQPILFNNDVYFTAYYNYLIEIELYKLSINPSTIYNAKQNSLDNKPFIYPNPFSNELNIKLIDNTSSQITLMDITGRIIEKFNKKNELITLNTSALSKGIYILNIEIGKLKYIEKIIKN